MVVLDIKVDGKPTTLYMDNRLSRLIDTKVIPNVMKKDSDGVYIVDGEERSGKSVFAMQLGKKFDPNLKLDNICFSADEFTRAIIKAKKGDCVIYDEAFTGYRPIGRQR